MSRAAPNKMASVDVSPTEPGINPRKPSQNPIGSPIILWKAATGSVDVASCPRGVAPENALIGSPAPHQKASRVRTHTWSPLMAVG